MCSELFILEGSSPQLLVNSNIEIAPNCDEEVQT